MENHQLFNVRVMGHAFLMIFWYGYAYFDNYLPFTSFNHFITSLLCFDVSQLEGFVYSFCILNPTNSFDFYWMMRQSISSPFRPTSQAFLILFILSTLTNNSILIVVGALWCLGRAAFRAVLMRPRRCSTHNTYCCAVLYCTVLYCTVLYCTVLYCTVLYCTVLPCYCQI